MAFIGKKIETSCDNFGDLIRENCLIVDKTMFIKEFILDQKISLITRPRRFGKTINMSMLQHFFSKTVTNIATNGMFKNLLIAKEENGEFIKKHQGQYPVIFLSFKDLKEPNLQSTISQLRNLIQTLYREHQDILRSDNLNLSEKTIFHEYLSGSISDEKLQLSLAFLSEFLYKAYNKKTIILIDEYDTPLSHAHQYKFLDPLSDFMRNVFSSALKGNQFLEKGLMTGILRVSKNNMLSGLNNLKVYTVLDAKYAEYFGFIEEEVNELMQMIGINDLHEVQGVKKFYNGYNIGNTIIYNPWSLMHYLDSRELIPYWVLTANDGLLKEIFLQSDDETRTLLGDLMQGKMITGKVNLHIRYEDLLQDPDAIWTLLLFCGYLTVEDKFWDAAWVCQLKIPNKEILEQYTSIFKNWFERKLGRNYTSFLTNLAKGNVEEFTYSLSNYLMESLSFHDITKKSEKFYHGFVAGLIASIRDTHFVDSNKESGRGRYDIMLIPKNKEQKSIIIEFKKVENLDALPAAAQLALKQINTQLYSTALKKFPYIESVLKIGLAFCEKAVMSVYQTENLSTKSNTAIVQGEIIQREDEW